MPAFDRIADLLIEREAYRICPVMPQRNFVSFCRDRNIKVSDERLRHLEHLRLFAVCKALASRMFIGRLLSTPVRISRYARPSARIGESALMRSTYGAP
jgi:hypothetical protein